MVLAVSYLGYDRRQHPPRGPPPKPNNCKRKYIMGGGGETLMYRTLSHYACGHLIIRPECDAYPSPHVAPNGCSHNNWKQLFPLDGAVCFVSYPGPTHAAFQCCTLKSGRARYLKSRALAILLHNKQLEKADKTNRLFFTYGVLWLIVGRLSTD